MYAVSWNAFLFSELCDNWQHFHQNRLKFEKGDFLTFSSFRYLSLFIVEISIEVQIYEGAYFDKPSDVLQAGIWKSTKCLQYHVFFTNGKVSL